MLSPIDIVDWRPVLLSVGILAAIVILLMYDMINKKANKES